MVITDKLTYENFINEKKQAVTQSMYGIDEVIQLCLVALYTQGHVLLEGNPGLGKTALVKALASALKFPFGRIQFTPDLMPADITGTLMPGTDSDAAPMRFQGRLDYSEDGGLPSKIVGNLSNGGSGLAFRAGPIFTSLLLADEINRATPKTQAAMLEAMAERQVTVLGEIYPLDEQNFVRDIKTVSGRPFMVLATQNPVEHEGTFELPEAQSDRFMFKILMPTPAASVLQNIVEKERRNLAQMNGRVQKPTEAELEAAKVETETAVKRFQSVKRKIAEVEMSPELETHITNIYLASNNRLEDVSSITKQQLQRLKEIIPYLQYGIGPRAATALSLGARAWTLFFVQGAQVADAPAMAQITIPVLRHRIKLNYDWYDEAGGGDDAEQQRKRMDEFLSELCIACAPASQRNKDYKQQFEDLLQSVMNRGAF